MTNYEKFKDKIVALDYDIAMDKNGKLAPCHNCGIRCEDCGFSCGTEVCGGSCRQVTVKWLFSEYEEPKVDWSKVPVDTLVLVKDSERGDWIPRYFAEYVRTTDGWRIGVWEGGRTSKTVKDGSPVKDPRSFMSYWKMGKLAEEDDKND